MAGGPSDTAALSHVERAVRPSTSGFIGDAMASRTVTDPRSPESPLEAAAGAASPRAIDAFKRLGNETRLGILLALWEAYDPHAEDNSLPYSAILDRVQIRDSGQFSYHLNQLLGHFVEETDDGYALRNSGLKIVQTVISGAGLEAASLDPTEIVLSCHRCGAPVELSYEGEYLYHTCTQCEGNTGENFTEDRPVGTLMRWDFNPSGLANRTPGELFVAGMIKALRDFGLLVRGLCPQCTGTVEGSLQICEDHRTGDGAACPACGTRDEIRVQYRCAVCKYGDSYPVDAVIYDHPAVIAFCYDHDIEHTFDLDDPEACARLWEHISARDHQLASTDPVRIRVTVPADEEHLRVTLDESLDVLDVTRSGQ